MNTTIYPRPLSGQIKAPTSKSLMHRAVICAALSKEQTRIINPLFCDDTNYTMDALKMLGVEFNLDKNGDLIVKTPHEYNKINNKVACGNSGSTLRMLAPILTYLNKGITFTGDARLMERVIDEDFDNFSFNFLKTPNMLTMSNFDIINEITIDSFHSSQTISGYLMAAPLFGKKIQINLSNSELDPYIKMTIDMMMDFNINIDVTYLNNKTVITVNESKYIAKTDIELSGDYSQAANYLVSASLAGPIEVSNLLSDSSQGDKKIIDILKQLGANVTISNNSVRVEKNKLTSLDIDLSNIPDLGPLLISFSSLLPCKSSFTGLKRLIDKESNRLLDTMDILCALGIDANLKNDKLIVNGNATIAGNVTIDCKNDHRMVFWLCAISPYIEMPIKLLGTECINKSYPTFFDDFKALGGEFIHE